MIIKVEENSIAWEMDIEAGDELLSINGQTVIDVFDYRYLIKDEYLEVEIKKANGEIWELEIEKDEDEELGIVFETGLMDRAKSCSNKCIFCFIDQLPKNMRETLYFKDDDSRLSFLQGNYVTLTNMKDLDLDRIAFYHLSPINISVHTVDPKLREFMLKNKNSSKILKQIEKLCTANIEMNYQIVLCNGINDGEKLDETIEALSKFIPKGRSLSVVPVGISNFRENLFPLQPFSKEDSTQVINQVHRWQEKLLKSHETAFVFAADEFYLKAELEIPKASAYEDFPQIENGVGMLALFENEFIQELNKLKIEKLDGERKITVVTGAASYKFMTKLSEMLMNRVLGIDIRVVLVENVFLGEHITVSGLLTGRDIMDTLEKNRSVLGELILLPKNLLRSESDVLLDDIKVNDIENRFGVKVIAVEIDGAKFVQQIVRGV